MISYKMVNYADGKVYAIKSKQTDQVYIGSTCQELTTRLRKHKSDARRHDAGTFPQVASYHIVCFDDAVIELVQAWPCESRNELLQRERFHIENTENCVNVRVPGRTRAEHYIEKRETILAKNTEWRLANDEHVKAVKKQRYDAKREELLAKNKVWREANAAEISARRRARYHERKALVG